MSERTEIHKVVRENHLDFLYDLFTTNVPIGQENIDLLINHGYIEKNEIPAHVEPSKRHKAVRDRTVKTIKESVIDQHIEIVEEGANTETITEDENEKNIQDNPPERQGKKEIHAKDWMPPSVINHDKYFVEWIDSINFLGFKNRKKYWRYNLYRQQAMDWLAEGGSVTHFSDPEEREEYKIREIQRCDENTLYFLNKYLKLKEGDMTSGSRDYEAKEAHMVICFLFDSHYSFYLGKPRQIAATSTLGGCGLKKILFSPNFFLKFITQDKLKGEEIFEDKIKYPFAELPDWMKPVVRNDRDNLFALGYKEQKGDREGANTKLQVVAPSKTAISGGSPSLSFIDEAGNIPILTQIIEDGNPTMYWMNPKTGQIEIKRQLVVWGTGGDMDKGGKAFEREFMAALKRWQERNFSSGIVPVFFDWTTRPGITQEFFDQKKAEFYSKEGPDAELSRVNFHQQYPTCIEDMFLSSAKTLVSQEYINGQLDRIRKHIHILRPKYGYFEPIYGQKPAAESSDTPFDIIGVNFIPTDDGDPRSSVIMFQEPKQGWKHRYYQGTDPIASDTGLSNMASAVWDNHYKTISCVVDYRVQDYKQVFLQCMLLGMYYEVEKQAGIHELLETNIGLAYRQYKENKGYGDTMVYNAELPAYLQTQSGNLVGIDNRGMRNKLIIDKLFEMIQAFGEKNYIEEFFGQLKTFICTVNAKGNESWGPMDRRYYKDDILFACVFAYICSLCYPDETPIKLDEERKRTTIRHRLVYDANWKLTRVAVRVRK